MNIQKIKNKLLGGESNPSLLCDSQILHADKTGSV